jgi:hypothetical protein
VVDLLWTRWWTVGFHSRRGMPWIHDPSSLGTCVKTQSGPDQRFKIFVKCLNSAHFFSETRTLFSLFLRPLFFSAVCMRFNCFFYSSSRFFRSLLFVSSLLFGPWKGNERIIGLQLFQVGPPFLFPSCKAERNRSLFSDLHSDGGWSPLL